MLRQLPASLQLPIKSPEVAQSHCNKSKVNFAQKTATIQQQENYDFMSLCCRLQNQKPFKLYQWYSKKKKISC